jgi:hypothetical protein
MNRVLARKRLAGVVTEVLEIRRFLCGGNGQEAAELRELMGPDGHLKPAEFEALPASLKADVDPHTIEDNSNVDYPVAPNVYSPARESAVSLPDLMAVRSSSYLNPYIDTTEIAGHQLLRFSTAIGNQGDAPAILTSANSGTPPAGSGISSWINADGTQNVLQRMYTFNGTSYTFDSYRPAGRMTWHDGHGHFHLDGYARYRLLTNVGGQPGPVAKRSNWDNSDAVGDKIGFCLINISPSFTMTNGLNSTTLPGYNKAGQPSTSCGFLQGIHVGRADVYDSIYDGQWIDVTGVPNGNYFLEVTLDAENVILETNEDNNTVLVPYTLNTSNTPGGIAPDRFEPNNTFEAAIDLGVLGNQTQPGLTSHVSQDADFFSFVAASSGTYTIELNIANRDVNLFIYDSNRTLLDSSTSDANGPTTETVQWNFVAGQTYFVQARGFGTATTSGGISSGYAIKFNINPTINASQPDDTAAEVAAEPATISIARNGPTSSPLAVSFTVGGTATRGVDYNIYHDSVLVTGNSISIGNEAATAELEIVPLTDTLVESTETVILTLSSASTYVVGGATATVSLRDTPPVVTLAGFDRLRNLVSFDFSLDVSASLAAGDLLIRDINTLQTFAVDNVVWSPSLKRATFKLPVLPTASYEAVLGRSGVTHALGEPLAADGQTTFAFARGDASGDGIVDFADLFALAQNFGNSASTVETGDVNFDGVVDFADLLIISQEYAGGAVQSQARTTSRKPASSVLE